MLVIRQNSTLTPLLNFYLMKMRQSGIVNRLHRNYKLVGGGELAKKAREQDVCHEEDVGKWTGLDYRVMAGAFVLLGVGIFGAIATSVIEKLSTNSLTFGMSY